MTAFSVLKHLSVVDPGEAPPLCLHQTEAWRAEKKLGGDPLPPTPLPYPWVWMTGLDLPLPILLASIRGDPWTLSLDLPLTDYLAMNPPNSTQTSNVNLTETELVVCLGFAVCTCIPCEAKTQMSSFFLPLNTWAASPARRTGTCSSSVQQKPQGVQHDSYGFSLNIWSGHQMQCPKSHRDT